MIIYHGQNVKLT